MVVLEKKEQNLTCVPERPENIHLNHQKTVEYLIITFFNKNYTFNSVKFKKRCLLRYSFFGFI